MAKILVIDDERSIRNTLKDILEFEKHQVATAENGKQGLEAAQNSVFDLIFSDINCSMKLMLMPSPFPFVLFCLVSRHMRYTLLFLKAI